jgi:hypothetical protein
MDDGTVFKKDPKSSSEFLEDQKYFSFDTSSTKEYYEKDIVELLYSLSTYTRNNIKEILNLPVDLWKIENLFRSLNFHTCFLRTHHHATSQQQTTKCTNHHPHSNPMANVAKTAHGSPPPPPHKTNQRNNDRQSMTREAKGRKKRGANNDGNTAKKSHKRSSPEGNDDEDKPAGGANGVPGDGKRSTAHNGREASGTQGAEESKNDVDSATTPPDGNAETNESSLSTKDEAKGQKKRGANKGGNTAKKIHVWSSAEGNKDEDEAVGANGAPGDSKRSTTHNGRKAASGTQGAGSKNDVDGATMPPDCDAETNEQGAGEDTGHNKQGANEKSQGGTSTSNDCSRGNESSLSLDQNMQTPVRNTLVSKNGFFQSGKTQKSNFTIIHHTSLS